LFLIASSDCALNEDLFLSHIFLKVISIFKAYKEPATTKRLEPEQEKKRQQMRAAAVEDRKRKRAEQRSLAFAAAAADTGGFFL